MKHVRSSLLSTTFAVSAQYLADIKKNLPSGDTLKKEVQDLIHSVMGKILDGGYGIKSQGDDPDIVFEAGDNSGGTLLTSISPMLTRRPAGRHHQEFLGRIDQFFKDFHRHAKNNDVEGSPIDGRYWLQYYPPGMRRALVGFAREKIPGDPALEKQFERIRLLCSRYECGDYVPAHKLH